MIRWKKALTSATQRAERKLDSLKERIGQHFNRDAITIVPYRSYGTAERLFVRGRVLQDERITPPSEEDSKVRNLINAYKRFESDEVAGARVRCRFEGVEQEVISDEEGFFETWLHLATPLPADKLWHEVQLELLAPLGEAEAPLQASAHVLVPPPSAQFGVISDMDDTVVYTNANNYFELARIMFLGNALTRVPFEGVASFYQALQKGVRAEGINPIFYVSSSPWNIYDMLLDFLEVQHIPLGPLTLRNWGISADEFLPTSHGSYKINAIRDILDSYPHLPFILIGDSGQEDPEIYREIVHHYPERILGIYIRNVSSNPKRSTAIQALAEEVKQAGSELLLTQDTFEAAQHAAAMGWIG